MLLPPGTYTVTADAPNFAPSRAEGVVVNAVTRSGTNDHRGSAFYLIRHKELAANNDYIRALEADRGIRITPVPTQQQFGGPVGGPVLRDKLFYFFAYEQQVFRAPRAASTSLTTSSAARRARSSRRSSVYVFCFRARLTK